MRFSSCLVLAAVACAPDPLLIAPPWDDDAQVVLLVDGEVRAIVQGGAAAFAFDDVVGAEIVALAYAPVADGIPDLAACGVALAAEPAMPQARAAWQVVVRDGEDTLIFTPTDRRPALALVRCAYDPCPATRTESWALGDEDDEIRGVEILPDGDVLVALGDAARGGVILRWRDGAPVWTRELPEYLKGVGWDGDETIYASSGRRLVALDLEGATSTPARVLDDVVQVRSDRAGGVAARRRSGIASIDGAWPDLDGDFHALAIVPGGTGLAGDRRGLWRLDEGTWRLDFPEAAFGNVGGDAHVLIALNEVGDFIVFADGRWVDFEGPPDPAGLLLGRGRGDGQLVLAGNQGRLWFQEGDAWCRAETGTGQRLESMVVSDDGKTFVTGGAPATEHPDETPVLSIVTVLD